MGEEIGEGGFGKVFKATHKETGTPVAVKYMNISDYMTQADQINEIYRETNALSKLEHRNVIKLYKSFVKGKNVVMVMEFCGGGELYEYVKKKSRIDEIEAKEIF